MLNLILQHPEYIKLISITDGIRGDNSERIKPIWQITAVMIKDCGKDNRFQRTEQLIRRQILQPPLFLDDVMRENGMVNRLRVLEGIITLKLFVSATKNTQALLLFVWNLIIP